LRHHDLDLGLTGVPQHAQPGLEVRRRRLFEQQRPLPIGSGSNDFLVQHRRHDRDEGVDIRMRS